MTPVTRISFSLLLVASNTILKITVQIWGKILEQPTNSHLDANGLDIDCASQRLVAARQTATPLDGFPGTLPTSLEQAYALQSLSIERFGKTVAGWKVGMVPSDYRDRFDDARLVGPIFADRVQRDDGKIADLPVFAGGFAAIEAEILVELGRDIAPGEHDLAQGDVRDLIRAVYIGTEIASSPMAAINTLGPMAIISDFGNNHGLLIGKVLTDWRDVADADIPVSVEIDGHIIAKGTSANTLGGYLAAVEFLIEVMARRGMHLPAGTFVSTGAITGVHDAVPGSHSRVSFGKFGAMEMRLSAYAP